MNKDVLEMSSTVSTTSGYALDNLIVAGLPESVVKKMSEPIPIDNTGQK